MYLSLPRVWIEFTLEGRVAERHVIKAPFEKARVMGLAFTASGRLIGSMQGPANYGNYKLDRQNSSWMPAPEFERRGFVVGAGGERVLV